jgi:hypothetical protein
MPHALTALDSTLAWAIPTVAAILILVAIDRLFSDSLKGLARLIREEVTALAHISDPRAINFIGGFLMFLILGGVDILAVAGSISTAVQNHWHFGQSPQYQGFAAAIIIGAYFIVCLRTVGR